MQIWRLVLLFILIAIFTSVDVGVLLGLLLLILGMRAIRRNYRSSQSAGASSRRRGLREAVDDFIDNSFSSVNNRYQLGKRRVQRHALKAFRRAGHDPNENQAVVPSDVGVIVYMENQPPTIYRTAAVPDVADYIQPYLELYLNVPEAQGRIRFEIVDGDNQPVFVHEEEKNLKQGHNLITPAYRLPIHDAQALKSTWQLRISADGILLAEHPLQWRLTQTNEFSQYVGADGELTDELREVAAQSTPRMSLDDLLAMQPQSDIPTEREVAHQSANRLGRMLSRR